MYATFCRKLVSKIRMQNSSLMGPLWVLSFYIHFKIKSRFLIHESLGHGIVYLILYLHPINDDFELLLMQFVFSFNQF